MSTIASNAEDLILNADGGSSTVKIKINGTEKASISSAGAFTSTTIDATALTGTIPNFTSTGIDDNANATAITIDSSENVGIGVVPETWNAGWVANQINTTGSVSASATALYLMENAYYNGGWKYITTSHATNNYQSDGNHYFRVAPSGTADAAITWTTPLTITNDGRGVSQFTAKAWVNYDQKDTAAVRDSHNISSVTDSGTGIHQVNFSNAMGNANYAVSVTINGSGATATGFAMNEQNNNTTGLAKNVTYSSGTLTDMDCTHTIVFGD